MSKTFDRLAMVRYNYTMLRRSARCCCIEQAFGTGRAVRTEIQQL
jgi:hypothetical protein